MLSSNANHNNSDKDDERACNNAAESNKKVAIGSQEYYSGFWARDWNDDPPERVTGDAVLVPTLKLVGGFSLILGMFLVAFLASNGLL